MPLRRVIGTIGILVLGLSIACIGTFNAAADKPPTQLSSDDQSLARAALKEAEKKRWRQARSSAAKASEPLVGEIIDWLYMRDEKSGASFQSIAAFIEAHPEWPRLRTLRRNAEKAMPASLPDAQVLAWFWRHAPVGSAGKRKFGEALLASGDAGHGEALIREAWIEHDFDSRDEKAFLARHKKLLTKQDHIARLDRLLWDRKSTAARRQLTRVDKGYQRLALARLALIRSKGGVDAAIKRVPTELRGDAGLIYERVKWRRRAGLEEGARALLANPPADLIRPKLWWRERHILARDALEMGNAAAAYELAVKHGQTTPGGIAEAEWLAGWIALRFLDQPSLAYQHFVTMHDVVAMPISIGRGAYWSARAAEAAGTPTEAERWYKRAATQPTSFYGQLAIMALGHNTLTLPQFTAPMTAGVDVFEARSPVRVARMLGELSEIDMMVVFLGHLIDTSQAPDEHAYIAMVGLDYGLPPVAIRVAKHAARSGMIVMPAAYPVLPVFTAAANDGPLDAGLLLGLSRQESELDTRVISKAGARGLMQLMPATAKMVSKRLGLPYKRALLTQDGTYNVRLGSDYLAELIGNYKGAHVLALAAYNAGPSRVKRWIRENGDPRDRKVDVIDWIELIPFSETRNYVQRVLESAQVYRHVLADSETPPTLRLAEEMTGRPGPLAHR